MFDISRYTEGLMLAQTAAPLRRADGSRLALQLDMSPRGLQRSLRKKITAEIDEGIANGTMSSADKLSKAATARKARERYQARVGQFQQFARDAQDFDPEALDATGRWFKSVGIMGFSPTDWMGTAFAHLVDEGLDQKKAYEAVRSMYTYGTKGRSAAEMSANFVFFPFSFQKKSLGHIAKWMNDDLGRSIIIHDAMKTYELLDEHVEKNMGMEGGLDGLWKDHIPALQQLQKLNLFAYGISPGRLGGMNSQLFETTGKFAWNLFVPGALDIKSPGDAAEIQKLFSGLMPAINDITTLSRNLWTEQINQVGIPGTALGSPTHQTRNAQITDGFNEWNEFKTQLTDDLNARGYVFTDMQNKPWLEDVNAVYKAKKADLAAKYPAWFDFNTEFLYELQALNAERKLALDSVLSEQLGGPRASPIAHMMTEFETVLGGYREQLSLTTGSSDLTDAPPEIFTDLLRISEGFAERNPNWVRIWDRFYAKELGPITIGAELANPVA
ncbi:MAG: hypothetical protein H0U13_01955 [Gemmatimonadaceae bacterium]|nr:hypothetical protein [Gemmatimonadaceae bacterium]